MNDSNSNSDYIGNQNDSSDSNGYIGHWCQAIFMFFDDKKHSSWKEKSLG